MSLVTVSSTRLSVRQTDLTTVMNILDVAKIVRSFLIKVQDGQELPRVSTLFRSIFSKDPWPPQRFHGIYSSMLRHSCLNAFDGLADMCLTSDCRFLFVAYSRLPRMRVFRVRDKKCVLEFNTYEPCHSMATSDVCKLFCAFPETMVVYKLIFDSDDIVKPRLIRARFTPYRFTGLSIHNSTQTYSTCNRWKFSGYLFAT